MRGRRVSAAILAVIVLAGLAACGGSGGNSGVFRPAGSIQSQSAGTLTAPVRIAPGGFRFPADVSIQFATPLPTNPARHAILTAYQNYVLTLWAAALSHGKDRAYLRQAGGTALGFAQREVRYYSSHHRTIRGAIRYYNTTVTAVFFGNGANVTSCVDASGFLTVDRRTGATAGPVFPRRFARYLEDVTAGRRGDGTWFISRSQSFPASTTGGAMCK